MKLQRIFYYPQVTCLLAIFFCSPETLVAEDNLDSVNTNANSIDDDAPNQTQTKVSFLETKQKYNEIVDELANVPGLSTQQSGMGQPAYAAIRGGNPRQNRVFWNGLKLSLPFGPGFDFSTLDSVSFDSLTVVRAGSSATKGSGSLTGAIELNSDVFFKGKLRDSNRSYGSFGTYNSARRIGVSDGKNFLLFSGGIRRSTGDFPFIDRQGTPHIRVGNDSERVQVASILGRKISEKWTNKLAILYSQLDRGSPGPSEFQDLFLDARNQVSQVHISNEYKGQKLDSVLADESEAKFMIGVSGSDYSYRNPTSLLGSTEFESVAKHRRVSSAASFRFFSTRSLTTMRLDASFEKYESQTTKNSIQSPLANHERSELSLKVASEWYWNASWLTFLNAAVDHVGNQLLPTFNIGTSIELLDGLTLSFNGARSSRAPDFDELYLETESVRGNPDLRIESAWTTDLSVYYQNDIISLESTFFGSIIDNTILFLPVSSFLIEAKNIGEFPSFGMESSANLNLKHLEVEGSYTLTLSQPSGFQSPHQPVHKGTLKTQLHTEIQNAYIKSARVFANANARSAINLDLFGSLRNEASLRINAGLSIRLDVNMPRKIDITLGVKNILDDRTQSDFLQRPLPGRQVYGALRLTL